ncbi:MAG TPA: hypothetical protein VLR26_14495 [Frankiaceae bacterium]|nr:hypothetical protein [Frankiaceae bacterium]
MSVETVILLVVLLESLVLVGTVRWLVSGLRSSEGQEWPPIPATAPAVSQVLNSHIPNTAIPNSPSVPTSREAGSRADEPVAAAS